MSWHEDVYQLLTVGESSAVLVTTGLQCTIYFHSLLEPTHEIFVLIALLSSDCSGRPMQVHRLVREFSARIRKVWMYMKVKPLLPFLEDLGLNNIFICFPLPHRL